MFSFHRGTPGSKCWNCCVWSRIHLIFSHIRLEFDIYLDKCFVLDPGPGLCPWTQLGGLPSQEPLASLQEPLVTP